MKKLLLIILILLSFTSCNTYSVLKLNKLKPPIRVIGKTIETEYIMGSILLQGSNNRYVVITSRTNEGYMLINRYGIGDTL